MDYEIILKIASIFFVASSLIILILSRIDLIDEETDDDPDHKFAIFWLTLLIFLGFMSLGYFLFY